MSSQSAHCLICDSVQRLICDVLRQGQTTFADELEYWTVKSLFGCA